MLVDSHCHLDRLDLAAHNGSLDAALDAARQRGVGHFLCIGVSAENAAEFAGSYTTTTLPLVMRAAKEAGLLAADVDLSKATDPQYLG